MQYKAYIQKKTYIHSGHFSEGKLSKYALTAISGLFNIFYAYHNTASDKYMMLPIDCSFYKSGLGVVNEFYSTPEEIIKGFERPNKEIRGCDFLNQLSTGEIAEFTFPTDVEITKEWYQEFKTSNQNILEEELKDKLDNYTLEVSTFTKGMYATNSGNDISVVTERKYSKSLFRNLLTCTSAVEHLIVRVSATFNNVFMLQYHFTVELTGISCGVHTISHINGLYSLTLLPEKVQQLVMTEFAECLKKHDNVKTFLISTTARDWKGMSKLFNSEVMKKTFDSVTRYSDNPNSGNRIATTILILK